MQTGGAYVEQIPAGAKPPATSPPALKIVPGAPSAPQSPPPPGLYVQVASAPSQEQALRAGLELSQRLGANRPPFIRGVAVTVEGKPHIRMFAGPFADEATARRFCSLALPGQACSGQVFDAQARPEATQTKGPTRVGPRSKGD